MDLDQWEEKQDAAKKAQFNNTTGSTDATGAQKKPKTPKVPKEASAKVETVEKAARKEFPKAAKAGKQPKQPKAVKPTAKEARFIEIEGRVAEQEASHAIVPVDTAKLPLNYEEAKKFIGAVVRVDECKDWSDRAVALASYARQMKDQTLIDQAQRIKLRATRRAGELLAEFDARGAHWEDNRVGGTPNSNGDDTRVGGTPNFSSNGKSKKKTKAEAAKEAGLSPDQTAEATRIAKVDQQEFDQAVEGTNVPSTEAMAERGRKTQKNRATPDPLQIALVDFGLACESIGTIAKTYTPKDLFKRFQLLSVTPFNLITVAAAGNFVDQFVEYIATEKTKEEDAAAFE